MLESNKDAVLRELDRKVEKALTMIGEQAVGYAQEIVHENEGKNAQKYVGEASERSGELANLMEFEVDMSDDSVIIGTDVEYAPYVEFGHLQEVGRFVPKIKKRLVKPQAPAYPFLRPALEKHLEEYNRIANDVLKNG